MPQIQRLKSQNARFHQLVAMLKLDRDEKKEVVRAASAGRATSSKDLTAQEMQRAIDQLSGQRTSSIARMRAKARAIANDIGILGTGPAADYTALNVFIEKKFKKKNMFELDYDRTRDLITALERWRDGLTKKHLGL